MSDDTSPGGEASLALSIVIPVYNEAANIEPSLHALKRNVPVPHEIIIVYDFDEDNTVPVVQRLSAHFTNVRLAKNTVARGPSGALRTGFAEAKASRVLVVMADLCDDLTQIEHLLNLAPAHADIACPSRYCKGGAQIIDSSRLKAWPPRTAGFLLKLLAGIPTFDPTNSFKLYSSKVLKDIPLASTTSFSVTLEIIAKAHCLGYRIVEVPTVWRDRQHGKTNFKFGPSLVAYFPWFCIAMLHNRIFRLPQSWLRALFGCSSGRLEENHAVRRV